MVRVTSPRAIEFACYAKSCAPPPAGSGGSGGSGGGAGGRSGGGRVKGSDLKAGDKIHFAQKKRTISSLGKQKNGKIGISFKDGGITDVRPDQTFPKG